MGKMDLTTPVRAVIGRLGISKHVIHSMVNLLTPKEDPKEDYYSHLIYSYNLQSNSESQSIQVSLP